MRTKINRKSDFDFIVIDSEGNAIDMPSNDFTLDIWTWRSACRFRASSIGGVLKGCKNDGGKLRIYVDNPGFAPGKLVGEWVSYISNEEYQDGTQRTYYLISDFGIDMVDESTQINDVQVVAMMQYIKGASAYEIACEYGFEGTEQEWLDSLALPANEAAAECKALIVELNDAEAQRVANEDVRTTNEGTRVQQESARVSAEEQRTKAEANRQIGENTRDLVETTRQNAERNRDNAEAARVSAENTRKMAEDARIANEATRQTNEQARAAAETSRESAETNRANAEAARVEAEQARAEEFAGFTTTLAAKEDVTNKVTTLGADATDEQYPSAKAVKDLIDSHTFPIINNLTVGGEESALSAEMGKKLNLDKISKESATTSQYPELTGSGFIGKAWYAKGSQLISSDGAFTLFVPVEAGERLTVTGIYNIAVYPVSSSMPSAVGDIADFPNDGTLNGNEITYQHAGYAWLQSTTAIRVTKNKGLIIATKTDGIIPPIENTTSYLDGQFITKETMQNGDIMPLLYDLITPSRNLLDPASFDPLLYIQTGNGSAATISSANVNSGGVVVRNVVLNGSFCFSASRQLLSADSGYNGISIQPSAYEKNNTIYAALTGPNFGNIKGKGGQLNFTMLPEYNGWKITANIEFPCDIYIGVGERGASTNMQFEEGDTPTNFVSYGEKIVGTDWSPQISALSQSVVALQAQIDNVKSVPSRWTGCRYVACGDSITDKNCTPTTKYCTLLNDALATTSYLNAGSSGATLCTVHTNNFVDKIRTLDLTAFDLMTIMLGVNDKARNAPMGTIDGSDTGTFYGAWNDVISYIITANPSLKVVLLTPFNTGSSPVNELGLNVKDYADAVLAIGTKFSIPVVDCFRNAGICPNNWGTYTLDNVHPNALGHEWAAGYIIAQVKNL